MNAISSNRPLSQAQRSLIRSLARRKRRKKHSLFLAEGIRLVSELSELPEQVEFLYADNDGMRSLPSELSRCPIFMIEENDTSLFATDHSQGVGAVVRMKAPLELSDLRQLDSPILYLDQLADPGNAGTILRAADWFGIMGVLFGKGSVDPWNPKAVRASMGAIFRLQIGENLTLDEVVGRGRSCYLLEANASASLGTTQLDPRGIYVIGNEAHGLAHKWKDQGKGISIPSFGEGDSLNAAMAATILFWELSRLNKSS